MSGWLAIAGVAAGTYLMRASALATLGRRPLPSWTSTPIALIGPAAMAALAASMVFTERGLAVMPPAGPFVALAAGALAVRRSRQPLHALTVGMPVLWAFELLM